MITDWVGRVQKGQNIDYVIYEWSLDDKENRANIGTACIFSISFPGNYFFMDPSKQTD